MSVEIEIRPGSHALQCPHCGSESLSIPDGDSIPVGHVLPRCRAVADGRALSRNGYCFSPDLNLCVCDACKGESYIIQLDMVNAAEVSTEWADKYFCMNEDITEPAAPFTVHTSLPELPPVWSMERTETSAGTLDRHSFGPFVTGETLQGPNGVSQCAGGNVWPEAAALIARVWPYLAGDGSFPPLHTCYNDLTEEDFRALEAEAEAQDRAEGKGCLYDRPPDDDVPF